MATHNTHTHADGKPNYAPAYLAVQQSLLNSPGDMAGRDVKILLRKIMRACDWTQADLARELELTQPTISRLLAGAAAKFDTRVKILGLARRLSVINNSQSETLQNAEGVPVVATIGTGGELRMLPEEEQEIAPAPPGELAIPGLIAARVVGTGMMPMLDDGWIVYWDRDGKEPPDGLTTKLCVVGLIGGQVLVRRPYKGRTKGRYDLHAANAPALLDQPLEWMARVLWILPR